MAPRARAAALSVAPAHHDAELLPLESPKFAAAPPTADGPATDDAAAASAATPARRRASVARARSPLPASPRSPLHAALAVPLPLTPVAADAGLAPPPRTPLGFEDPLDLGVTIASSVYDLLADAPFAGDAAADSYLGAAAAESAAGSATEPAAAAPGLLPIPDSPDAFVDVAEVLLFGLHDVPANPERAFVLLLTAAHTASHDVATKANALVGFCYEFGLGTPQSFLDCEPYYTRAAEAGQALAMGRLSFLRRYGRPYVRMNRAESEHWLARVHGLYAPGAPALACNAPSVHDAKPHVTPDGRADPQAWLWWAAGPAVRDASAQYALGTCFHDGVGVPRSPHLAVSWYAKSAAQGSARGEGILGYCYGEGFGIQKDSARALQYYRAAAEKGETVAMYNVGYCYEEGIGVEPNLDEAFRWYRRAAEAGNALAANSLGYFYEEGISVDKDVAQAMRWYRAAAEQGNPWAEHNLAYMYATGTGVEPNPELAFAWYARAAEQGHAGAQNKLAHCYQTGTGTAVDNARAVHWYRKAVEQQYPQAAVALAWCLDNGVGCRRDPREALELLDFAMSNDYKDHLISDWYIALAQRVVTEDVAADVRRSLGSMCAAETA